MLYTGCIDAKCDQVGVIIHTTCRLTDNTGLKVDQKLAMGKDFDGWMNGIGPPGKLVYWWYTNFEKPGKDEREIEFRKIYLDHLRTGNRPDLLMMFGNYAIEKDLTFTCVEPTGQFCHRYDLAEETQRLVPKLELNLT